MRNFVFDEVENIVGKGENAGSQHFLLSPQCFQKASATCQYSMIKEFKCGFLSQKRNPK